MALPREADLVADDLRGGSASSSERDARSASEAPVDQARVGKDRSGEGSFQIPSLDGIRAVSFLIVFLSHAGLSQLVPGYFGLTVFFFLSGYLITTLLRMEFDRTGTISWKGFYVRRTLRIFPPLYLVLAVACGVVGMKLVRGSVLPYTVLAQAAHLTNYYIIRHGWWTGIAPGTWVYWSLAVEEHFYLFFPLLYWAMRRRFRSGSQQALFLAALCLLVLAWRCVLIFHFHVYKDRVYLATDTRVDAILIGCILAVWQNPVLDHAEIDDARLLRIWTPLGVLLVVSSFAIGGPQFEQTFRYTLQSFGLFPLFIVAIRWHDRGIVRVLNWGPARRLGALSYSLYLMHTAVIWAFQERTTWSTPLRGAAAFAVLLVLATLMQKYVEQPCARLRKKLSRHFEARRAEDGAAPMAA